MTRFVLPCIGAVIAVFAATGCGTTGRTASHPPGGHAGNFPVVVAHPKVQTTGLSNVTLRPGRAVLLSPSRLAFMTSGSISCVWLPTRLTVLGPSALRIEMRINGAAASCTSGLSGFPIAVKIDPRVVDVHRSLTVRLDYKANYGAAGGFRQWHVTAVAPAFGGS